MGRRRLHLGEDIRELDFTVGQVVYLRCRDEPVRGVVTGYSVSVCEVCYFVAWGNSTGADGRHYGFELTSERPVC